MIVRPILILAWAGVLALAGCAMTGMRSPTTRSLAESRQLSQQALAAMERDQWPLAEQLMARAVKACPENSETRRYWAEVLWRRGNRAEAVAQLEQISSQVDDRAEIAARIAEMRLALGQTVLAEQAANHAIDLAPKAAEPWAVRGRVLRAAGQPNQALADLQRAAALDPANSTVALEIAETYRDLGRPERALATLNGLAANGPVGDEPAQLFYLQGLVHSDLGRYEDAVESFTKAIVRDRPTVEVLYHLAEAELAAGRASNAAAAAREALALDPRHQPSLELLGRSRLESRPASTASR